ncbi:MAG: hypothetical protein E6R14_00840 [Thermomicrobiales bacterium]|nr:MAG: hypothetical protein E6R14_00840 [Thermomicrobiales bacterium]
MHRHSTHVPVGVVLLLLVSLLALGSVSPSASAQATGNWFVYHQITNFPEGTGGLGYPVLSGDGTTAAYAVAPGTQDPATPNRIFTINADGSSAAEVDSYVPLCFCGSIVDISNDGGTVVSTDSVQVRIVDAGGARVLLTLAGNEISRVVITGNGLTVFMLVRRDTATSDNATAIPRGVWAIDANGENLRQLVDATDIATAVGVTIEETGCCFHSDGGPLDVSDDGGRVVFAAYAAGFERFYSVDGSGGNLVQLSGDQQYTMRVAVSGDGALAAFDGTPAGAALNDVGVIPTTGGEAKVLTTMSYSGFDEPFQLTQSGSRLLVSSNGLLFDTASGEAELLGVSIANTGGNHLSALTDGLPRGTMDAEGQQFLYVMRSVRCADCANQQEQLAIMTMDPVDLGAAPVISNASIEPATILPESGSEAVVSASISADGQVLGVGYAALLGSEVDPNLGRAVVLFDDGTNGDAVAGDSTYTIGGIVHQIIVAREPDTGPRTVRLAAEIEDANGMRHATAVDIGTLTVDESAASR